MLGGHAKSQGLPRYFDEQYQRKCYKTKSCHYPHQVLKRRQAWVARNRNKYVRESPPSHPSPRSTMKWLRVSQHAPPVPTELHLRVMAENTILPRSTLDPLRPSCPPPETPCSCFTDSWPRCCFANSVHTTWDRLVAVPEN